MLFPRVFLFLSSLFGLIYGAPTSRPRFRGDMGKVVGGEEAFKGQFPYQVSLQESIFGFHQHFCGGTIISPDFVVTAGHCVEGSDFTQPFDLRVVAGEHNLKVEEGDEQEVKIHFIHMHPFFSGDSLENDIALLHLETSFEISELVVSLDLPLLNMTSEGECVVSGWGKTTEGGGTTSDVLRFATLEALPDEICRASYPDEFIYESMICAGSTTGKGSCQGDSGGPLTCTDIEGHKYLAGVVSWGYGCARPEYPTVYTEVSNYVNWIESHM